MGVITTRPYSLRKNFFKSLATLMQKEILIKKEDLVARI